jgi:hypothetical protein
LSSLMPARRLARLLRFAALIGLIGPIGLIGLAALAALAACSVPRAARGGASCPDADRLLSEAVRASDGGRLFRALARAEAAERACSSDATRAAVVAARGEL